MAETQTADHAETLAGALDPVVSRVRTDVTFARRTSSQGWTREALTEQRLARHVGDGADRGVCPIAAGDDTTRLALLDLDAHGGETPWAEMTATAARISEVLAAQGLYPIPWRSSGGAGIHLFLIWDEAQDAYSVRAALREALGETGLDEGTAGVAAGQVEVFPKQDRVPEDGYGNQFILPLAGQSVPLEPMLDWEPMDPDYAVGLHWPVSEPVALRARPERGPDQDVEADLATIQSAADAIPNHGADELGYDEWLQVGMAIHAATGGSDEGMAIWDSVSARHSAYESDDIPGKWASFKDREDGVGLGTLFKIARRYGWQEPTDLIVRDFEPLDNEAEGEAQPTLPPFERDDSGRPKATLSNVVLALGRPEFIGWRLAHDDFRDEVMLAPHTDPRAWRPFRDTHYTELRLILERGAFPGPAFKPVGREMMRDAVEHVAERHHFDSARHWLETEIPTWDGVARVGRFLGDYFGADANGYTQAVSSYIWTALAGRILNPGCQADMMPILVGAQGVGKSSGVAQMVPSMDHYFEVDLHAREDDLARRMRGRLLGEVGELRGLHSREIEGIKAFITRNYEHWIPKYREFAVTFPRRCIFIGTTNDQEFLADETGNRRFLPVVVNDVDREAIDRDRAQLWAEARELWRQYGILWKRAEQLAEGIHAEHMIVDPWREPVQDWLDQAPEFTADGEPEGLRNRDRPFQMQDVMRGALGIDPRRATNGDDRRIGAILREMGCEKTDRRVDGRVKKVWVAPSE